MMPDETHDIKNSLTPAFFLRFHLCCRGASFSFILWPQNARNNCDLLRRAPASQYRAIANITPLRILMDTRPGRKS